MLGMGFNMSKYEILIALIQANVEADKLNKLLDELHNKLNLYQIALNLGRSAEEIR